MMLRSVGSKILEALLVSSDPPGEQVAVASACQAGCALSSEGWITMCTCIMQRMALSQARKTAAAAMIACLRELTLF